MRRESPLVREAVAEYLQLRRLSCADTTVQNDGSVLGRFATWCCDRRVATLTASVVERYFLDEVAPRNNAASFNKVLQRVRGLLVFCGGRGWLSGDPLVNLRPKAVTRRERLRLNADELLSLLEYARNPRDRALLAIAMNTGLRASDITALRVGTVDLANRELHVFNHKSKIEDSFPITRELNAELRDWLRRYADDLMQPVNGDWYLLPARQWARFAATPDGVAQDYGPWAPQQRLKKPAAIVQRALKASGISSVKYEGLHTVRRSVGRSFFEHASDLGHDAALRATASLLHHKSVATTELYIGITEDRRKRDAILKGREFLSVMAANAQRQALEEAAMRSPLRMHTVASENAG